MESRPQTSGDGKTSDDPIRAAGDELHDRLAEWIEAFPTIGTQYSTVAALVHWEAATGRGLHRASLSAEADHDPELLSYDGGATGERRSKRKWFF